MSNPEFRPLDGVRVIELSHMIMGPACGMFLALLGAEVIKVEPPGGDKTRYLQGMGRPMHPLFNRGKKSVCLDTATPDGRAALHRLLASADVLVENFRDASLADMGLDLEALRTRYPRLIISGCKGFLSGPYQDRTALDEVVQMMTGLAYMTGPPGRPLRVGSSANDIMGGLFGAFSVLAALLERQTTGEGRTIRVGLFENCLLLVAQHMVQFDLDGVNPPPMPARDFSWPVYDVFQTASGQQIFVSAVTDGQWHTITGLLGLENLRDDPRLQGRKAQIAARSWTIPIFAEAIGARTAEDLTALFEAHGIPFSPISKPGDMFDDPHVARDGGLDTSAIDGNGTFRAPSLPFEVDGAANPPAGDVSGVGADTAAVLASVGLAPDEIAACTPLRTPA
ncbi:CaiB/BaiF CoA-transferase family protein [Aestuariivita sp.]|jgi:crotonobetainyl-CoA:carnitine CoA-transferase CaiB-like acyl-CoA transferase|uniref:CaiB/BaiF CoA transferase family protein n=1 Tax=Aestuariivita sp. TaxID=1872407 RepID=UPI00216BA3BF|nr:CaiB/BaiF CoA-transferase family protein [Aestuariivita sp.]MCE8008538.1 CoA transferase [Aestuariivita sp.]